MERCSGILMPIFSLPSQYGIGCFDSQARGFVDFLKASGQSVWQILPLGPTGYGDSPYQSFSCFAGNPYFIDLSELIENGWLTRKDCDEAFPPCKGGIDYDLLYKRRIPLLYRAFENSNILSDEGFCRFREQNGWLSGYCSFMAIKDSFGGRPFHEWPENLRLCRGRLSPTDEEMYSKRALFHAFLQYIFYSQWAKLKSYANKNGVKIIGDIPIYTSYDSADVWVHPELFQLDGSLLPTAIAGCPPDGFSKDGQLWGNPLYDWDRHRSDGFRWWGERLSHSFEMYDIVRIDHFRGFDEYYSIPYGDKTAVNGRWEKGPAMALFRALEEVIGKRDIIAEDLGFVTDSVKKLVSNCGFMGMKVLQFAFDSRDTGNVSDYLPHNYPENSACYTGTHDNQTLLSWLSEISDKERQAVREYLCDKYTPDGRLNIPLIYLLMRSPARLCVIPLPDWLSLPDKARINTPSVIGGNWQWRLETGDLTDALADKIALATRQFGRSPVPIKPAQKA